LLDRPELDVFTRNAFVHALLRLRQASGLYPRSLVLRGVQQSGLYPIAFGTFGDVWLGTFRGEQVAIKATRISLQSDMSKLLKVCVSILHDWLSRSLRVRSFIMKPLSGGNSAILMSYHSTVYIFGTTNVPDSAAFPRGWKMETSCSSSKDLKILIGPLW
jgi:hypothetical protein